MRFTSSSRRATALLTGLALAVPLAGAVSSASAQEAPAAAEAAVDPALLEIKPVSEFVMQYEDKGSGASKDVSFWRPRAQAGFYSLGDVAMEKYGAPQNAFLARDTGDGKLAAPLSYSRVWQDSGSGADMDGSIWRPAAPAGYRCLGDLAQPDHNTAPSVNAMRCVKEEFTEAGKHALVWDDTNSGGSEDVRIDQADPLSYLGLPASTFHASRSYTAPAGVAVVLNKQKTSVPVAAGTTPGTAEAQAFAPRIWLSSGEKYMPGDPNKFLAATRVVDGHRITNEPINNNKDNALLLGENPTQTSVPAYAEVLQRTEDGKPNGITDILYWQFYPFNKGKDACFALWTPLACGGISKNMGNHLGDWTHMSVRFNGSLPEKVYFSAHAGGAEYTYGDKHVLMPNWQIAGFAGEGSHELYAEPGDHTYAHIPNGIPLPGQPLTDKTNKGYGWDLGKNLHAFNFTDLADGKLTSDTAFIYDTVTRWGTEEYDCVPLIGFCEMEEGPSAPLSPNRWYANPPMREMG